MIRELVILSVFLFVICLVCWLIAPSILGRFNTSNPAPLTVAQIVMVSLPLILFVLIVLIVLKARSGD